MTQIVMLSAKQGGGKSTIANALIVRAKELKYSFVGVEKFATTLYTLHDILLNKMETLTGKPRVKKDGVLLQLLGTEWGRKVYGDNVWVDILKHSIGNYRGDSKRLIIIDDCRFENEFDAFPEALRVRLECPSEERKQRTDAWRDNEEHPSETGLDTYAKRGLFDLNLNTSGETGVNVNHAVSLIFSELQRKSWLENR